MLGRFAYNPPPFLIGDFCDFSLRSPWIEVSLMLENPPAKRDWYSYILLMAEISNNHLGCLKPCKQWDKPPINWCRISAINSNKHIYWVVPLPRIPVTTRIIIFLVGNPNLNLHLPLEYWEGGKPRHIIIIIQQINHYIFRGMGLWAQKIP